MSEREPWYAGLAIAVVLVAVEAGATLAWSEAGSGAGEFGGWALFYGIVGGIPFLGGYYIRGRVPRLGCFGAYGVLTVLLLGSLLPELRDEPQAWLDGVGEVLILMLCAVVGISAVIGVIAGSVVSRYVRRRPIPTADY